MLLFQRLPWLWLCWTHLGATLTFDHGHQWLTSMTTSTFLPTISPFVIDGNTHTLSCSPCHHVAPPVIMLFQLPLSFISPFDINGKGNAFWCSHAWSFGEEITPNFCLRYSKVSHGRGLVNMSAIYSFVSTYSNLIFFYVTCSLWKWNLTGMCFVLECITRFLDMFIALVLS